MKSRRKKPSRGWRAPKLKGKVAVVTGASRGAGRGIANVLGECGATVYVTGRSVRGGRTVDNLPGTIHDTAREVTARGGRGIPVRCDHTKPRQVAALFHRIRREQGRLDLLVNNAWGGYEGSLVPPTYFWKVPVERLWKGMFEAGLWTHFLTTWHALPLMLRRRRGVIVSTIAWDRNRYIGNMYDVAKHAIVRFIHGLALELRQHRIAAMAVAPGFMRTERVLGAFKVEAKDWRSVPGLAPTETPEYVGRGIARLAADRNVLRRSGRAFRAGDLARLYRFPDTDGRRVKPFVVPLEFVDLVEQFAKGEVY